MVIALMLGGAISAKYFDYDVVAELNRRQAEIDNQYMADGMGALSAERSALELELQIARETVEARRREADANIQAHAETMADLIDRLADHRDALDRLNDELRLGGSAGPGAA